MKRAISLILTATASTLCACGSQAGSDTGWTLASSASDAGAPAEAELVVSGEYEDRRFLDMMAAHHQMAIEQAKIATERAEHADLRALAQGIVDAQTTEIGQIRSMKQGEYGSADVPLEMNQEQMSNMGTLTNAELVAANPFDLEFLDGMIPHHAGAITMASVARLHSHNPRILTMARGIVDAQSAEIGKMIAMRKAWYPRAP
jgi:uncharacterized protein (DUF305 family)